MLDHSEATWNPNPCDLTKCINSWNLNILILMILLSIISEGYIDRPGLIIVFLSIQSGIVIYQWWIFKFVIKRFKLVYPAVRRLSITNMNFATIVWSVFTTTILLYSPKSMNVLIIVIMTMYIVHGAVTNNGPLSPAFRNSLIVINAPLFVWGVISQTLEGFVISGMVIAHLVIVFRYKKKYDGLGMNFLFTDNRTTELVKANKELESEIHYRKNMEKALRASEEKYRTLFQNNPIETIIVDHNARITGYNKAKARSLGRVPEIGDVMYKDYGSRHANNMFEELMDCIRTGEQKEFPEQKYNQRYLHIRISPYSGGAIITSLDITKTKKAEEQIQTLTREILMIQENERKRIARDLHDSVAQDLSSLRISCETFFDDIPESSFKVRHKIREISKVLQGTIHAIRDIAYELRPPSLDELGLPITLFRYCEEFKVKSGINIDFVSAGLEQIRINPDTEINLYRLVQEALNNIRKHAGATKVNVRLVASYPHVILRVEDNGIGFDVDLQEVLGTKHKHMGMRSMEERVSLLGGKMNIKSRSGEGTRIFIEVPALKMKDHVPETSSAFAANE